MLRDQLLLSLFHLISTLFFYLAGEVGWRDHTPGKGCKLERARWSKEQSPLFWWFGIAGKVWVRAVTWISLYNSHFFITIDFNIEMLNLRICFTVHYITKVEKLKQQTICVLLLLIILHTKSTWNSVKMMRTFLLVILSAVGEEITDFKFCTSQSKFCWSDIHLILLKLYIRIKVSFGWYLLWCLFYGKNTILFPIFRGLFNFVFTFWKQ